MKTIFTFLLAFTISTSFSQGVPLPYNTGFDSAAEKLGWQQFRTGYLSTYSWGYGGSGFSAPTCVSHDYNVGGNPNDTVIDWFVSPPINFTSTATMSIKVKTGGFSTPSPDNFEILFGSDIKNPANGNYTVIANLSNMTPQYQWLDTTFTIPFVSDSGYIALKYKTIGAAWMTYAFDNISIVANASSVNENMNESGSMKVYPNPFTSQTTIKSELMLTNASLLIYNVHGELVKQVNMLSGNEFNFDGSSLGTGLYMAELVQDKRTLSRKKIIITR
jgi:hypothetical protein